MRSRESEERCDGLFVSFLRSGEAGFVDPVVDVVVSPVVDSSDVLLHVRRKEVEFGVLFGQKVIEFVVEHPDDVGRFVGHDGLGFLVVKGRDSEAATVVGIVDVKVDLAKVSEVGVDGVLGNVLAW